MNTQNKTAHTQGNSNNNPLKPLQQVVRNKANLITPVIGLNAGETLSNIGSLLDAVKELSGIAIRDNQHDTAGLTLLIETMQAAISYETRQGAE